MNLTEDELRSGLQRLGKAHRHFRFWTYVNGVLAFLLAAAVAVNGWTIYLHCRL